MGIYLKIEDAEGLMFPDGVTRVETATDYLGWQAAHINVRRVVRACSLGDVVYARVNWGRWITDCLRCGQGVFTHPVWKLACCMECGAIYRAVVFPSEVDEITRLLLERPKRSTQNWERGESITRLKLENVLHRLAS